MAAYSKASDSRLMTVLVQVSGGISGAIAIAAVAIAMWPKVDTPVLPSIEPTITQEMQVAVATPFAPANSLPDDFLVIEDQKPPPEYEIPSITSPNPY